MVVAWLVVALAVAACVRLRVRGGSGIVLGDMVVGTVIVFFVVPLGLQIFGTKPSERIFPGLSAAQNDPLTQLLSGLLIVILLWSVVVAAVRPSDNEFRRTESDLPRLWVLAAISPMVAVLASPSPAVYSSFGAPFLQRGPGQAFADSLSPVAQFHVYVTMACFVSVFSIAVVVLRAGVTPLTTVAVVSVGASLFWLTGKRFFPALLLVLVLIAAAAPSDKRRSGVNRRAKVSAVAVTALVFVGSNWYQNRFRSFVSDGGLTTDVFLVDYSRLAVLNQAVDASTGGVTPSSLDYAGQSPILHLGALIGSSETISYVDRITSVALGVPVQQRGGGLTTSILSEGVDNFGVFGGLIAIAIVVGVLRLSLRSDDDITRFLGVIVSSLLLVLHVLAFLPLIVLFVGRALLFGRGQVDRQFESQISVTAPNALH